MPYDIDKLHFKPGDPLLAAQVQAIVEEILRPSGIVRGGAGLSVRAGARGQIQVSGSSPTRFVGKAASAIAARSGTAWGAGTVTVYGWDGSNDYSLSATYDVVNPGPAIASGQYCWVEEDGQGNLVVAPLAAGNHAWCQLGSSLGPATGTFGSLTPTSASVAVYRTVAGAQASLGTCTVYNWRNVTWAAGKTMLLLDNGDGTFDIDEEDC